MAWEVPGNEAVPNPAPGFVVSFVAFHERGFSMPPHDFLRGLLQYYGVGLHHLTPNFILHAATFVALCEGFLDIPANFDLWKRFFRAKLQHPKDRERPTKQEEYGPGCVAVAGCGSGYPQHFHNSSNKGWREEWFYLHDAGGDLPAFVNRLPRETDA